MSKRIYRGKALDVAFDADTCIHAAECVRGLPAVFDPERKPWILPDAGDAAALRDVVALCPSGASRSSSARPRRAQAASK